MNKCKICNKEILSDSQYINGNYYHNACIEQLQQENNYLKQTHDYDLKMIDEVKGNSVELFQENKQLKEQNEELKQKLNWIAFGDEPELALRYLRKIGYVDFDEERKVYINKHNNEPFWLDDEEEKTYFIEDEELNEYTKQLEQENKQLKEQNECLLNQKRDFEYIQTKTLDNMNKKNKQLKQRDEVIDEAIEFARDYDFAHNNVLNFYNGVLNRLQKYKGDNNE